MGEEVGVADGDASAVQSESVSGLNFDVREVEGKVGRRAMRVEQRVIRSRT